MGIEIRPADRADAPTLAALHLESALTGFAHIFPPEAEPPTTDQLCGEWEHCLGARSAEEARTFIAEHDGTAVGVVLAGPDPIEPTCGHVARLYVLPERWGTGTGRALYEQAITHLQQLAFAEATLWVLEHNHRARGWYERLGWRPTGERRPVYAPGHIDDLRYRTRLPS